MVANKLAFAASAKRALNFSLSMRSCGGNAQENGCKKQVFPGHSHKQN